MKWNIVTYINRFRRMYTMAFQPLAEKYGLNQLEIDILLFLHNNPEYNTARDIVEKRGFAKSNVSTAVEALRKKEYLVSKSDPGSRKIHRLHLLAEADKKVQELAARQRQIAAGLAVGFTEEECLLLQSFTKRINDNVEMMIEKMEEKRG